MPQNNAQARGTGERNASSDVTLVLATEFQCTQSSGPLITTPRSFVTTITVPVDTLTKHRGLVNLVSKCFPFHAYCYKKSEFKLKIQQGPHYLALHEKIDPPGI